VEYFHLARLQLFLSVGQAQGNKPVFQNPIPINLVLSKVDLLVHEKSALRV
jgi:hypothetical protein